MEGIELEEEFQKCSKMVQNLPKSGPISITTRDKLNFYALYKQGTEGACKIEKPGMFDMTATLKYNAWKNLKDMSKEEAQKEYVKAFKGIMNGVDSDMVKDFESSIKAVSA